MSKVVLILVSACVSIVAVVFIFRNPPTSSINSGSPITEQGTSADMPNFPISFDSSNNQTQDIPNDSSTGARALSSLLRRSFTARPPFQNTNTINPVPEAIWPERRYRSQVFSDVSAQKDIVYKSTYNTRFITNANGNFELEYDQSSPKDLKLNIYQPVGDRMSKRPLLIFVYGGGWIDGDRYQQENAAIHYAKMGYVTITLDYTMMPPGNELNPVPDAEWKVYPRIIYKSATNIYEAYQWALESKDVYNIDTTRIGVGGWSAGGMISHALVHINSWPEPTGIRAVLGLSNILPAGIADLQPLNGIRSFNNSFNPVSMFASYEEDNGFAGTPNDHAADCAYLDSIGHRCITITYPGVGHQLDFNLPPNQVDAEDFFARYVAER